MKPRSAFAGILTLLATLFTNISPVFAQSTTDSLAKQRQEANVPIDFESVAKRLNVLSEPTIAMPQQDSLSKRLRNKIKKDIFGTHGRIDLSYAYGLNTVFIDTSRSIGSILSTNGDFSTSILGLPINLSFNYTTLRVPLGTNNYFRLSLDKNRLVQQQKEKLTASITGIEGQQETLQKKQAELSGMMGYLEIYMDALKRKAEWEAKKRKSTAQDQVLNSADSLKSSKDEKLSLENPEDYQKSYDSINRMYQRLTKLKTSYDSLSMKLASSKEMLSSQVGELSNPDLKGEATGKIGFIKDLQTFDIGLTYPKTTALSSQNVPIKGLNFEIQHKKYYLSAATGLTLNNMMLSTNEVQNQLNYSQNVFNNFDFQQMKKNGWLTAIKTGYGTVDGSHAFIGFNYITNTKFLNPSDISQTLPAYDPAASVELDLRYVPTFLKGSAFDLVYGKTSKNTQLDTTSSNGIFRSLFSAYPSNLFLGKYTQAISRLKSDFTASYRRLDTYANTSTFGMMQPNNQRLELKTNHRMNQFVKLSLLYRMDATLQAVSGMNNLRLNMLGATVSGAYTTYFSYSVFFNHVHHSIRVPNSDLKINGNNYLAGINLSSNYDVGKAKANSVVSYNDYLITDTVSVNKFSQFGLIQTFTEKEYAASISYDYFYRRIDGLATGTSVFGFAAKYILKKGRLGAGLKLASDFTSAASLGGHLEGLWSVNRFLDLSIRAERFVLGDFYRNYYRAQYEQFPYLITFQTRFKI